MADNPQPIPYATPAAGLPVSGYGVAALTMYIATVVWDFTEFGIGSITRFDGEKHSRIVFFAWLLGLALTLAAYRQPGRSRRTAHAATVLAVVALAVQILFPTL